MLYFANVMMTIRTAPDNTLAWRITKEQH